MSDFDPGPGWREVTREEALRAKAPTLNLDGLETRRYWVRVAPVQPLPTEPYTVIRAWPASGTEFECILRPNGQWWDIRGVMERDLQRAAHFVVLAEPCHEHYGAEDLKRVERDTAKAVLEEATEFLDRAWQPGHMRVLSYDLQTALFAHIRDRFGVSL